MPCNCSSSSPSIAQKPRNTELWLDSLPADSVHCNGLTVQFARFFLDGDQVSLLGASKKGTKRRAIDIWVSNQSDSTAAYDPHMFAAMDKDGNQINFWTAEEIGAFLGSRGFALEAETDRERSQQREVREKQQRESTGRPEYASTRLLPGAVGGRKILVPDNDKKLKDGITLFCGEQQLGLLHKK